MHYCRSQGDWSRHFGACDSAAPLPVTHGGLPVLSPHALKLAARARASRYHTTFRVRPVSTLYPENSLVLNEIKHKESTRSPAA